jgi:hypothetical protein
MATGTFTIDTRRTFAVLILMASGPRTKYGTSEQDTTPEGHLKWELSVAATWLAEPGRRAASDVLQVTIAAATDPAAALAVPCQIELEGLRLGVTTPQAKDQRVMGGKPWYQAEAVHVINGHRPKAEGA